MIQVNRNLKFLDFHFEQGAFYDNIIESLDTHLEGINMQNKALDGNPYHVFSFDSLRPSASSRIVGKSRYFDICTSMVASFSMMMIMSMCYRALKQILNILMGGAIVSCDYGTWLELIGTAYFTYLYFA